MTTIETASIPQSANRSHLTDAQHRALRSLLSERLQTHRDRAARAAKTLDEFTSSDSPDDREAAREKLQGLIDGALDHEDALRRLDSGTYGLCTMCEEPIPFERLEAIPEVNNCMGCARRG